MSAYAPGKMFLIGEYAVVVEHHPAILLSLNKGVKVSISASDTYSVNSKKYNAPVELTYAHKQLTTMDNRYQFTLTIINTFLQLVDHIKPFSVVIDSELDNEKHEKYGLGSSGALIVAMISALSRFFDKNLSLDEIFKLSVIVQLKLSKYSSFGDLAASTYGGCIYYEKGNVDWVDINDPQSMIHQPWDGFIIERLPLKTLDNLVGYSGVRASSTSLVSQVMKIKDTDEFKQFLNESKKTVMMCKNSILDKDVESFFFSINKYRDILLQLQKDSLVQIEIDTIKQMIESTLQLKGVAKTSGAGGGDCVIAFAKDVDTIKKIKEKWQDLKIEIISSIKWG